MKKGQEEEELHPVRFSHRHVDIIKHIMGHFSEYFEQEAEEFFEHLRKSEEGTNTSKAKKTEGFCTYKLIVTHPSGEEEITNLAPENIVDIQYALDIANDLQEGKELDIRCRKECLPGTLETMSKVYVSKFFAY